MSLIIIKGSLLLIVAGLPIKYPLENFANNVLELSLTSNQILTIGQYRILVGLGLGIMVVLILLSKMLKLRMVYYEVVADRIEWSRGILDRRVDNIDMFRVIDLKMRRSLIDCILGIGTVALNNDRQDRSGICLREGTIFPITL